mmetsp:Transcript_41288/g.99194  ORF Transcript_41288/g.99194 Transcript_41288/m.99194 type:complete len:254 (+) Transcript_41288:53-814(+)
MGAKRLTAFYIYMAAKREELKAAGRDRPDIKEVARLWNLLPEQERREWDNRAREAEKLYIQELRDRPDGASAEGEEAGVSQAGDESDEEERNLLALQLPFARVTKIIKLNGDLLKISRDACFLTARVTELFLERAVVDAAGTTSKAGRKTVTLRDIVTSMRGHPNPEALQAFVDELLLPPPKEEAGAAKPKPKRAPSSKKRASPAPGEGETPPAKLARAEAEAAVAAGLTEAADAVEAAEAAEAAGELPLAAQ